MFLTNCLFFAASEGREMRDVWMFAASTLDAAHASATTETRRDTMYAAEYAGEERAVSRESGGGEKGRGGAVGGERASAEMGSEGRCYIRAPNGEDGRGEHSSRGPSRLPAFAFLSRPSAAPRRT